MDCILMLVCAVLLIFFFFFFLSIHVVVADQLLLYLKEQNRSCEYIIEGKNRHQLLDFREVMHVIFVSSSRHLFQQQSVFNLLDGLQCMIVPGRNRLFVKSETRKPLFPLNLHCSLVRGEMCVGTIRL